MKSGTNSLRNGQYEFVIWAPFLSVAIVIAVEIDKWIRRKMAIKSKYIL